VGYIIWSNTIFIPLHPQFYLFIYWSQKEPFNWPTINTIGTWANPQHKSQNMLMSLKYNHVLWCFPLALYTSLPMTFLFYNFYTLKLNHGQTIRDNKMKCYLEHLGNTLRIKKHPTHLRWTTFSSTLSEHFQECLTLMVTLHMKTSSYFAFAL
jgi:hypothetical protein